MIKAVIFDLDNTLYDYGECNAVAMDEFKKQGAELLGKSPLPVGLKLYGAYWDTFIDVMRPYDGATKFLRDLKTKGIKTAICTDMTAHIQYRKLEKLGMAELFDAIVTSEEAGAEKPAPVMFQLAVDKLGARPSETVYIGDAWEKDVEGAINTGLTPVWFVHNRNFEPKEGALIVKEYSDDRLRTLCGLDN